MNNYYTVLNNRQEMFQVFMLALIALSFESIPITEAKSIDTNTADRYLDQYGYYGHHEPRAQNLVMLGEVSNNKLVTADHSDTERQHAVKKFQKFFGLPQTGELDELTSRLMTSPRCGVVDKPARVRLSSTRRKRYAFYRNGDGTPIRWQVPELTWALSRPTGKMSVSQQREQIMKALNIWREVVPISFREERDSRVEADIDIRFASRRHGPESDPVFDGAPTNRPNALAHAWGPHENPKGLSGDVHFDEDDRWTTTNFLSVAVHELGHTMGLVHSKDPAAIMYPVYQMSVDLSEDDLAGIRVLYGSGRREFTARPPQTRSPVIRSTAAKTSRPYVTHRPDQRTRQPSEVTEPPTRDSICTKVDIEAIFTDPTENQYIVVSGQQVHRISFSGQHLMTESLNSVFPDAPANTDVAFSYDSKVYFIKDSKMWVYRDNQLQSGFPRTMEKKSLPETPKFALLYTASDRIPRPLLFGSTRWWTFREIGGAPNSFPIDDFVHQFPKDVVFAAQWSDDFVYVVSRDSYVKIDQVNRKIINEEPVAGMPDWLNELCSTGNRLNSLSMLSALVISMGHYLLARLL